MKRVTGMVIGGTRSGKSEIAEGIFTDLVGGVASKAVYVATGPPAESTPLTEYDRVWAERIAIHRERRPSSWSTVEVGSLDELSLLLTSLDTPVIVDSLTILAAQLENLEDMHSTQNAEPEYANAHAHAANPVPTPVSASAPLSGIEHIEWSKGLDSLRRSLATRKQAELVTMFVADEVGLSVHPPTRVGVEFQDRAGILNSTVAALCDNVWFVVAGWAIEMDRVGKLR